MEVDHSLEQSVDQSESLPLDDTDVILEGDFEILVPETEDSLNPKLEPLVDPQDIILPDEIWVRIFLYLGDPKELCQVSRICSDWKRIANDNSVWHTLWLQHYGSDEEIINSLKKNTSEQTNNSTLGSLLKFFGSLKLRTGNSSALQGDLPAETHSQDGQQHLYINWKHQFLQRYSNFYAKSWLEGSGEVIHLYTKKTKFEIGKPEKVEAELWIRATKRIPTSSIKTRFYCKEQAPVFRPDGFTRQGPYTQYYYFDQKIYPFGDLLYIEPGEWRFPFLIDFPGTDKVLAPTYSNKKNTIYVRCLLDTTLDRSFPFPSIHVTKYFRIVPPVEEASPVQTTSNNDSNTTNVQQPTPPVQNSTDNNTDNSNDHNLDPSQQTSSPQQNDTNSNNNINATDTTNQPQNDHSDTTQSSASNPPGTPPTTQTTQAPVPNPAAAPVLRLARMFSFEFRTLRMTFGLYNEPLAPGDVARLFIRIINHKNKVNHFLIIRFANSILYSQLTELKWPSSK
jgi:hypothetical protein